MKNTKETIVLMLCLSLIFSPSAVFAAPQGGKVVGGSANIQQSGATTTINQSSDRAIINWHSFDIGKNEAVRHNMPSRNSAGLHRVVGGGGASQIQGLLQSNGNVYLVNPAGVVIHKGARVDTNSFIATTRDISDSNFMKGKMVFDRPGRPDAQIINQGSISVRESGLAALVAPTVRNEGLIAGKLGKVALASGDATWKLDMHGDDLITFTVDENDVTALHATDGTPLAGVENSGSIKAEGGVVVLTAAQLDGIVGSVVNSGEVSAASAELKGGKITFRGEGSQVDVCNTGTVDASSAKADGGVIRMTAGGAVASSGTVAATGGQKGGTAVLTGREVALTGTAKIDISGDTGGGTALVGGNALGKGPEHNAKTARVESGAAIHADAKVKGDGGQVVVWSDEKTSFDGTITARGGSEGGNGGQVETSGKSLKVGDNAKVDTSAKKGVHGQWLLDPVDFVIAASGGDITGATVSANLELGDVTIRSDSGSSGTNGDIFVNDVIAWSSDTELTLHAERDVDINSVIKAIGDTAGLRIEPENGVANIYSKITLSGDYPSLYIKGKKYKIINSVEELQNMNMNLSGYYALGSDIDASDTKNWNNGAGFKPIGENSTKNLEFTGVFNGLGHTITGLTINRPTKTFVGLFGFTRLASIGNVGLENVSIVGYERVGSLMGESFTSEILNSYSTGTVTGHWYVSGFIARLYGGGMLDPIGTPFVSNCFTSCNINKLYQNSDYFGGFIALADGWESYVRKSYSTGSVPNTSHSGGFCADLGVLGHVENSFFDKDTSGKTTSSGGKGYTTVDMMKASTYDISIWDFEKVWDIDEGNDYPKLKLFAAVEPSLPSTGGGTTEPSGNQSGESQRPSVLPDISVPEVRPDKDDDNSDMIGGQDPSSNDRVIDDNSKISVDVPEDRYDNNRVNITRHIMPIYIDEVLPGTNEKLKSLQELNYYRTKIIVNNLGKMLYTEGIELGIDLTLAFVTGNPLKSIDALLSVLGSMTDPNLSRSVVGLIYYLRSGLAYTKFEEKYNEILHESSYNVSDIVEIINIAIESESYGIAASVISDSVYEDWKESQMAGVSGQIIINNAPSLIQIGSSLAGVDDVKKIISVGGIVTDLLKGANITGNTLINLLGISKDELTQAINERTYSNIELVNIFSNLPNIQFVK